MQTLICLVTSLRSYYNAHFFFKNLKNRKRGGVEKRGVPHAPKPLL